MSDVTASTGATQGALIDQYREMGGPEDVAARQLVEKALTEIVSCKDPKSYRWSYHLRDFKPYPENPNPSYPMNSVHVHGSGSDGKCSYLPPQDAVASSGYELEFYNTYRYPSGTQGSITVEYKLTEKSLEVSCDKTKSDAVVAQKNSIDIATRRLERWTSQDGKKHRSESQTPWKREQETVKTVGWSLKYFTPYSLQLYTQICGEEAVKQLEP